MDDLLDRLRALPCGAALLAAAGSRDGVHLVGGAVRDLLLDRVPVELDLAVEGDPAPLVEALGGTERAHDRFGTARVVADGCRYDLAMTRAESYARPGALPDVRPASIDEDLGRRDVTVNAIAVGLADGVLRAVPGALEDLRAGLLRVLHDDSFRDDPTRLWRIARYRARLGFALEEHTAALAREAVAGGAPATVSGVRLGNELRLALVEPDPPAALASAVDLGLAGWLDPDPARIARAVDLLGARGLPELAVLGSAVRLDDPELPTRLYDLAFTASAGRIVLAAVALRRRAPGLRGAAPSVVDRALGGAPVEAVAAAGAEGAEEEVRRWLEADGPRALRITGADLLGAGVEPGPEVGRRLRAARDALLDGAVGDDAGAQLQVALGA